MEFRICGKLDENGQLQSVGSHCSHAPLGGLLPGGHHQWHLERCSGVRESKVVSYAVKQDLDRKMDEMSQLMVQLKQTQESLETAKKLNKEYEEKIKRFEQACEQLTIDNANLTKLLQENGIHVPHNDTMANTQMSATIPKVAFRSSCHSETTTLTADFSPNTLRSSTTELTFALRHSSIQMTDSLYSEPVQSHDQNKSGDKTKDRHSCKDKGSESEAINVNPCSAVTRPNKLDISKSASCKVVNNKDDQTTGHGNTSTTTRTDDSSCSPSNSNTLVSDLEKETVNNEIPERTTSRDGPQSITLSAHTFGNSSAESGNGYLNGSVLPCDEDGYLILKFPTHSTLLRRKTTIRTTASNAERSEQDRIVDDDEGVCSCCKRDGEAGIHMSWNELRQCRNSCGSPISPVNTDQNQHSNTSGDTNHMQYDNAKLGKSQTDDMITGFVTKTHKVHTTDYFEIDRDDVFDQTTTGSNTHSVEYASRAPLPLPDRRSDSNTPTSSPPGPISTSTLSYDSGESCMKSEDKPNNVMKMMRKTSEWDSVKRKLLAKSHDQTSSNAENILSCAVKKTIEGFQKEFNKKHKRASTNMSDKVIKAVKESLKNTYDEDVLTIELLEKSVRLCEMEFL